MVDLSGLILDLQDALGRDVDVIEIAKPSRAAERIQREAVPPVTDTERDKDLLLLLAKLFEHSLEGAQVVLRKQHERGPA